MRSRCALPWNLAVVVVTWLTPTLALASELSERTSDNADLAAEVLGRILGVGVSPIFGLAMMGAYDHANARAPGWWASPYFYVPMFVMLGAIVLKDVFGVGLGPAKSVVDSFEVAASAFSMVPGLLAMMMYAGSTLGPATGELARHVYETAIPSAHAATGGTDAGQAFAVFGGVIAALASGATFLSVWATGHAFTILVFLNPVSFLDPFLKLLRVACILVLAALVAWAPSLSIVVSGLYIAFAYLSFGFFVRFTVFGSTLAFDTLLRRGQGNPDDPAGLAAFTSNVDGLPPRTYGRLRTDGGRMRFTYRPMFFRSPRDVEVAGATGLRAGMIYSTIVRNGPPGVDVITLPPRYRSQGDRIAARFQLRDRVDSVVLRGVRGTIAQVRSWFGGTSAPAGTN